MASVASANSAFSFKVTKLDGLLPKLVAWEMIPAKTPVDDAPLVLNDAFRNAGVSIPEGAGIFYSAGFLTCNLEEQGHEQVRVILEKMFETEDFTAACRAYLRLLEPLSTEDRLRTAMQVGYAPDPLAAQMIRDLRSRHAALEPPRPTPFDKDGKPAPGLQPEERKQLEAALAAKQMETSRLLDISLLRLKEQLSVLDAEGKGAK